MTREINIRLNANRAKVVHTGYKFASGDKGIVFKIAVEELETAGTTAKIVFKRSNGTSVEASVEGEDGIYSYTTLGNEFAVIGLVVADVKFYEGGKRISTCTFDFGVTSDTMDGIGAGTAGYSDTLERMKESMEQTESEMLAVETRAEEILQQMREAAEGAEDDVEAAEKKMADLTAELEALYREYEEAFGTSGPFNPRGVYSATETYTVRDMVTHNDASWVCYRNCTGETPSESSNCWQKLAIQVVDAQTLGGHGAEYFAPAEQVSGTAVLNTSILEKALTLETGVYQFKLGGGNYTGKDLPNTNYVYGNATVFIWAKNNMALVVLWGTSHINTPIATQFYNGNWREKWLLSATTADLTTELAKYLLLTGGTIDGNVDQIVTASTFVRHKLKNPVRNIDHVIYASGDYVQFDNTNNKAIYTSKADGTNTFNGHSSEDLPLDGGGTVSADNTTPLRLKNNLGDNLYLQCLGSSGTLGFFGFIGKDRPVFIGSDAATVRDLLHTGNSAKVHIGTSAPSDTASLWYDTANKKVKAYIDGAWTAAA